MTQTQALAYRLRFGRYRGQSVGEIAFPNGPGCPDWKGLRYLNRLRATSAPTARAALEVLFADPTVAAMLREAYRRQGSRAMRKATLAACAQLEGYATALQNAIEQAAQSCAECQRVLSESKHEYGIQSIAALFTRRR